MVATKTSKTSKKSQSAIPSRRAMLGWAVVWLALGCVAISEAIDTASWWYYLAVAICLAQLIRLVKQAGQHGK